MRFCFNNSSKLLIIILLSSIFFGINNHACAQSEEISIENEIETILEKNENDSIIFKNLQKLFEKYETKDFNKSVKVGYSAINLARRKNLALNLASWYGRMSHLYLDNELYTLSLEYTKLALKIHRKHKESIKWWILDIGNIYYAEEIYTEALNYYHSALEEFKKTKNKNDTIGLIVSYLNLAMAHERNNGTDSAIFYYSKSIYTCDLIKDYYRKTNACLHLSDLHLSLNSYDSVEYYIQKAEEYNRLSGGPDLLHLIKEKEGDYCAKLGMYNEALENYDLSKRIGNSFNDTRNFIRIYDKKAKVYMLQRKMELAIDNYRMGLNEALKLNNVKRLVTINKLISELYYYQLNIDSAYHFLWEYANWKDSMDNLNLQMLIYTYEKEDELKTIKNLESELAIEKEERIKYKYLVFAILILFIVPVAFLYYVVKSKRKLKEQNSKIIDQNNIISSQVEEITQQNDLLNSYKINLEKTVLEKTKHLEDAIKKAEESDRLKTAFLTNMSHEIRTPMNAVLGFGSLLSNTSLDETNRINYTEILLKSAEQLHEVINNIVEFSKIESGQVTVNKTYFDLNILFEELMLLFSKTLYEQNKTNINLEFTNQLPTKNNMIVADRNIIKQVFINLIDNAIKFTIEGSILFGCKLVKFDSIEFYVKDTGLGIDKEHFNKIFESFGQIGNHNSYKNKGIGLGLSISKSLVAKVRGQLFVESEKGKGSRFYFTVPYDNQEIPKYS